MKIVDKQFEAPGINPLEAGIDAKKPVGQYGGRPVYWDGKTEIVATRIPKRRKAKLQESLETLDKRVNESDLDKETKEEILKRRNNPEDLRDYLGAMVLKKQPDKEGRSAYRYSPGSLPYSLTLELFTRTAQTGQEFVAMLPFIFPPLKEIYQKANPGVKF